MQMSAMAAKAKSSQHMRLISSSWAKSRTYDNSQDLQLQIKSRLGYTIWLIGTMKRLALALCKT